MTTEQALDIISQATATFRGTLQDHQNIIAAINVIRDALAPKLVVREAVSAKATKAAKRAAQATQ